MTLAVVRQRLREGRRPTARPGARVPRRRGGRRQRTARTRWSSSGRELFEGVTEAIGEVGGFSITVGEGRAAVPDRDRGEGHGLDAADRARPRRPRLDDQRRQRGHRAVRGGGAARPARVPGARDADRAAVPRARCPTCWAPSSTRTTWRRSSPSSARWPRSIGATLRNTANPTMLDAGYKVNVVPGQASAQVDGRFLPGLRGGVLRARSTRSSARTSSARCSCTTSRCETDFDGRLVDAACSRSPRPRTPARAPVPYTLSGGTDAKAFWPLGHPLLRVRAAAAARRPGLRRAVPRRRRAGAGRRAAVRRAGARPVPRPGLTSVAACRPAGTAAGSSAAARRRRRPRAAARRPRRSPPTGAATPASPPSRPTTG